MFTIVPKVYLAYKSLGLENWQINEFLDQRKEYERLQEKISEDGLETSIISTKKETGLLIPLWLRSPDFGVYEMPDLHLDMPKLSLKNHDYEVVMEVIATIAWSSCSIVCASNGKVLLPTINDPANKAQIYVVKEEEVHILTYEETSYAKGRCHKNMIKIEKFLTKHDKEDMVSLKQHQIGHKRIEDAKAHFRQYTFAIEQLERMSKSAFVSV